MTLAHHVRPGAGCPATGSVWWYGIEPFQQSLSQANALQALDILSIHVYGMRDRLIRATESTDKSQGSLWKLASMSERISSHISRAKKETTLKAYKRGHWFWIQVKAFWNGPRDYADYQIDQEANYLDFTAQDFSKSTKLTSTAVCELNAANLNCLDIIERIDIDG